MIAALLAVALAGAPVDLGEAERAALSKREVVVRPDARGAVAFVLIHRPVADCVAEVEAFEGLSKYLPGMTESAVLERVGSTFRARSGTRVMLLRYRYGLAFQVDRAAGTLAWTLDRSQPSDLAEAHGAWRFTEVDAKTTLLRYEVSVDPGMPVPDAVQSYFTRSSLPELVGAFRDHMEAAK